MLEPRIDGFWVLLGVGCDPSVAHGANYACGIELTDGGFFGE